MFYHKHLLLIISGSIAAYKSPDIVRRAQELGAKVKVILSDGGAQFITQMSLETVGAQVYTQHNRSDMPHISLAKWADIVLVAPASSNMIAKIANGASDDLASLVILSTTKKVFVAPAMNKEMLANVATQHNLTLLAQRGVEVLATGDGAQACGDMGYGRMLEPTEIMEHLVCSLHSDTLSGKRVLLTIGATVEQIDPVRYISNHSSGKMGVALAQECIARGLDTTIIYGNTTTHLPDKATCISAPSALQMYTQVMEHITHNDIFIAVAAVSDYRATQIDDHKLKNTTDTLHITLTKNPDILAEVSKQYPAVFTIGFCVETTDLQRYATNKLLAKKLDMIVANTMQDGFGGHTNKVLIIDKQHHITTYEDTKVRIATQIIDMLEKQLES